MVGIPAFTYAFVTAMSCTSSCHTPPHSFVVSQDLKKKYGVEAIVTGGIIRIEQPVGELLKQGLNVLIVAMDDQTTAEYQRIQI